MTSVKIYVYPADLHGCGHYRLIWPAEILRAHGHDIVIVNPDSRDITARVDESTGEVIEMIDYPRDADVIVMQRVTHSYLARCIPLLRALGIAVVIDMDDDLSRVHPHNPAWRTMHTDPRMKTNTRSMSHSWAWCQVACDHATLVTTSTDALIQRYARHGRGLVLRNCVPERFLRVPHEDSDVIGWPASLASHPDDPDVVGGGVARALDELGVPLTVMNNGVGVARAFRLGDPQRVNAYGSVDLVDWPKTVTGLGIGLAPLADTQFNQAKSWLKPLECAALGVPVVMSPRTEYKKIHEMGVGLLARKPNDWYRHITRLARDPAERLELSERGRHAVRHWTYEQRAEFWLNAWKWALQLQRDGR